MESRGQNGRLSRRKEKLLALLRRKKNKRKASLKKKVIKREFPIDFPQEEPLVKEFRAWCSHVTIYLHPKLYIGRHGSCHELGVRAKETITRGEIIAKIPRSSLLNANNCYLSKYIETSTCLCTGSNSWLPLLVALIGEYSLKGSSHWQPYLNLVPNNRGCPPPIMWDKRERERLLKGTGLYQLVKHDVEKIKYDYQTEVEPFLINCNIDKTVYSLQLYTQLVAFVMSYSFTDAQNDSFLSQTMMIPFVDLLNHHTRHHVELIYKRNHLELIAIRNINQGEEIMNTFGQLPNYSLLHTHGFVETNNVIDAACVPLVHLQDVYLSFSDVKDLKRRQNRWKELTDNGMFDDVYEVDKNGTPEKRLLKVIKLLTAEEMRDGTLSRVKTFSLCSLSIEESNLLKRYIEESIAQLPTITVTDVDPVYVKYTSQMITEHLVYLNTLLDNINKYTNK